MGIIFEFFKGFFIAFRIIFDFIDSIYEWWDDFYHYTLVRDGYIDIFEQIAHALGVLIFIIFIILLFLEIFYI